MNSAKYCLVHLLLMKVAVRVQLCVSDFVMWFYFMFDCSDEVFSCSIDITILNARATIRCTSVGISDQVYVKFITFLSLNNKCINQSWSLSQPMLMNV